MWIVTNKYFVLACLFLLSFGSIAQDKESDRLKKQQKELQDKISFTENLLKSTSTTKTNLTNNLGLINNKINYREALLNNINLQQKELDNEIIALEKEIKDLEVQLELLIEQYKDMIRLAYKLRSNSASIGFILSSENFNQANKRMVYMEQITKYRADQIKRIQKTKIQLENDLILLENKKQKQVLLAKNKEVEKNRYISDLQKQKNYITSLNGKEQELKEELIAQRKKSENIKKAINTAIKKEIAAEREKEKKKPKTIKETKETKLSSASFQANKGRLPWPVSKGEITKGFGKQAHPVHAGVYTYNNGVDITTVKGSTVRAVYSGTISSVINIPGAGKAIIVSHGNYRTVYSNIQEAYVQKGDKIIAKQEIGSLLISPDGSVSQVHFEIMLITPEGSIKNLNPSYWLYK
jgi:septal ring factor EnvC (AmiA/AmiB activator)